MCEGKETRELDGDILIHLYVSDGDIFHCKYYLEQNDKDNYLWKNAKEQNEVATDLGCAKQDEVCNYKRYRHCDCGGLVTAETQICSGRASVFVTQSIVTDELFNGDV